MGLQLLGSDKSLIWGIGTNLAVFGVDVLFDARIDCLYIHKRVNNIWPGKCK